MNMHRIMRASASVMQQMQPAPHDVNVCGDDCKVCAVFDALKAIPARTTGDVSLSDTNDTDVLWKAAELLCEPKVDEDQISDLIGGLGPRDRWAQDEGAKEIEVILGLRS